MSATNIKKYTLLSDSLIYGLASVLANFIPFLLLPIYTEIFSPEQYAELSIVNLTIVIFRVVSEFGMGSSSYLFYYEEGGHNAFAYWVAHQFFGLLIVSSLLLVWLLILNGKSDFFNIIDRYFFIVMTASFLNVLPIIIQSYFRLLRKAFVCIFFNLLFLIINVVSGYCFIVFLNYGVQGFFYGQMLAGGVLTIFVSAYYYKIFFRFNSIRFSVYQAMLKYGAGVLPAGLAPIVFNFLVAWVITQHLGKAEMGIYHIAVTVSGVLAVISQSFASAWSPYLLQYYKMENFQNIIIKIHFIFSIFLILVCSLIASFAKEIFYLFLDVHYHSGSLVFIFQLFAYFFSGLLPIVISGMVYTKKNKMYGVLTVFLSAAHLISVYFATMYFSIESVSFLFMIANLVLYYLLIHYANNEHYIHYKHGYFNFVVLFLFVLSSLFYYFTEIDIDIKMIVLKMIIFILIGAVAFFLNKKIIRQLRNDILLMQGK